MKKIYEFNKEAINTFYSNNMKKKGYGKERHNFVAWLSLYNQEIRFQKLLEIGVRNGDTILDFGCGLGDLYGYTKKINLDINYIGVDINEDFINNAIEHYNDYLNDNVKFYAINTIDDVQESYDWFLASGAFTFKFKLKDIVNITEKAYYKSKKGVAFNLLKNKYVKRYIDHQGISDYNPDYIKKLFEKYFNKEIEIVLDYIKDDFTVYIKK